ncbi:DUF1858 domain-containing protein [Mobilitalea sibirica]|uniref:DUF1858 domain-containing protein n=1 Tax=Mobilitalea sibirica TaxID=1462919 RepID=A0A8J7L0H1_9FIRM|nr:DUF1858 domain-containing protein [Mobilitalea sibirica]MBH1942363.1 DUF1858 domain-containing protein [Mobilitalea sibirica]
MKSNDNTQKAVIDLKKSIYELCNEYPGLPDVLTKLGFTDITKPGMLQTVGRFMTLPKGSVLKKIPMDKIKETLCNEGYDII